MLIQLKGYQNNVHFTWKICIIRVFILYGIVGGVDLLRRSRYSSNSTIGKYCFISLNRKKLKCIWYPLWIKIIFSCRHICKSLLPRILRNIYGTLFTFQGRFYIFFHSFSYKQTKPQQKLICLSNFLYQNTKWNEAKLCLINLYVKSKENRIWKLWFLYNINSTQRKAALLTYFGGKIFHSLKTRQTST